MSSAIFHETILVKDLYNLDHIHLLILSPSVGPLRKDWFGKQFPLLCNQAYLSQNYER